MAGAFAAVFKIPHQIFVEEDDGFRAEHTVLGGAEREHVDARPPRGIRGRALQMRNRIGKARAIHVYRHAFTPGELRQRFEFW